MLWIWFGDPCSATTHVCGSGWGRVVTFGGNPLLQGANATLIQAEYLYLTIFKVLQVSYYTFFANSVKYYDA
jgi:hypothetical protein